MQNNQNNNLKYKYIYILKHYLLYNYKKKKMSIAR